MRIKDNDHFNRLLNRYLSAEGSDRECEELMDLIKAGIYDELLRNRIDAALQAGVPDQDMSLERAQGILEVILKREGRIVETEDKVRLLPIQQSTFWRYISAAAAVVVASLGVYWYVNSRAVSVEPIANVKPAHSSVFTGKQYVHLPDGSTVLLNEGGELRYGELFGNEIREVELVGEGYFDIQHDASKPFIVRTGKVTTTVLGTAFNVRAYPGGKVRVTVTRGKVRVASNNKTLAVISPDQQISVSAVDDSFVRSTLKAKEVEDETFWKSRYMILDDVSMETAAAIFEERYNAKLIFDNPMLKNCRITAMFLNGESLNQVITVISGVINAQYEVQTDGNVRLMGKGCK